VSCYFRQMGVVFREAGLEVTPGNKKEVDRAIHALVGVPYKDCPATWRKVKEMIADDAGREELVRALSKLG
jgi:hypothetical protein